jgi:hypothetical protein
LFFVRAGCVLQDRLSALLRAFSGLSCPLQRYSYARLTARLCLVVLLVTSLPNIPAFVGAASGAKALLLRSLTAALKSLCENRKFGTSAAEAAPISLCLCRS